MWILRWNEADTEHILKTFCAKNERGKQDLFSNSAANLDDYELVECFQLMAFRSVDKKVIEKCLQFMVEHHPEDRGVLSCVLMWPNALAMKRLEDLENEHAKVIKNAITHIRTPPVSLEKRVDAWISFIDNESHPENIDAF